MCVCIVGVLYLIVAHGLRPCFPPCMVHGTQPTPSLLLLNSLAAPHAHVSHPIPAKVLNTPCLPRTYATQTPTGAFLRAVLSARSNRFEVARLHVERARELMSTEFAALVSGPACPACVHACLGTCRPCPWACAPSLCTPVLVWLCTPMYLCAPACVHEPLPAHLCTRRVQLAWPQHDMCQHASDTRYAQMSLGHQPVGARGADASRGLLSPCTYAYHALRVIISCTLLCAMEPSFQRALDTYRTCPWSVCACYFCRWALAWMDRDCREFWA